jgi:hypothetical protein
MHGITLLFVALVALVAAAHGERFTFGSAGNAGGTDGLPYARITTTIATYVNATAAPVTDPASAANGTLDAMRFDVDFHCPSCSATSFYVGVSLSEAKLDIVADGVGTSCCCMLHAHACALASSSCLSPKSHHVQRHALINTHLHPHTLIRTHIADGVGTRARLHVPCAK